MCELSAKPSSLVTSVLVGFFPGTWALPDVYIVGVGAIFIVTLAVEQLPRPEGPPQSQTDILALSIEPVIAFMVMCSILIRKILIILKE
jgi:hypothetical protein